MWASDVQLLPLPGISRTDANTSLVRSSSHKFSSSAIIDTTGGGHCEVMEGENVDERQGHRRERSEAYNSLFSHARRLTRGLVVSTSISLPARQIDPTCVLEHLTATASLFHILHVCSSRASPDGPMLHASMKTQIWGQSGNSQLRTKLRTTKDTLSVFASER